MLEKNLTPWYVGEKIFTQTKSHKPHSKFKWSASCVSMLKRKDPHAFQWQQRSSSGPTKLAVHSRRKKQNKTKQKFSVKLINISDRRQAILAGNSLEVWSIARMLKKCAALLQTQNKAIYWVTDRNNTRTLLSTIGKGQRIRGMLSKVLNTHLGL